MNRREFLLLSPKNIFLNKPLKNPNISYSNFKSENKKFQYNTIIKDENNTIAIHTIANWFDPISKKDKVEEIYKLYILDEENI